MKQEVKVDVIPNVPGNIARLLHTYINQGYVVDICIPETNASAQNQTITTVIHKEEQRAWS
jgi:hypothetical protein